MHLSSPAFSDGDPIPWQYTAPKANELPPLQIADVPEQARSLVLILEDVDSPLGTLTHWLAWNIPPDTRSLDAVNLPAECCIGKDSFGKIGYLGPIPPEGRHHYRFSVLALDTMLTLEAGATRPALERAMKEHVLDQSALSGIVDANGWASPMPGPTSARRPGSACCSAPAWGSAWSSGASPSPYSISRTRRRARVERQRPRARQ